MDQVSFANREFMLGGNRRGGNPGVIDARHNSSISNVVGVSYLRDNLGDMATARNDRYWPF